MEISQDAIDLILKYEKFRPVKQSSCTTEHRPVIGYAHKCLRGEAFKEINEEQAMALLLKDLADISAKLNERLRIPLTQGQFDALCCLSYHVGFDKVKISYGFMELKRRNYDEAARIFFSARGDFTFVKVARTKLQIRRRKEEHDLWLK